MQVYELAKIRGVSAKELAKELGLKGHLSLVPDELVPIATENPPIVASEPVKEEESVIILPEKTKPLQKPVIDNVSREFKIGSILGGGHKSMYWSERFDLGVK